MKKFPSHLRPENIDEFVQYRYNRQLCYIRRHVYETMMLPSFGAEDKNDSTVNYGINLQNVQLETVGHGGMRIDENIIKQICLELVELGWETTISYGGSMIFVYPPGFKPVYAVNCTSFE